MCETVSAVISFLDVTWEAFAGIFNTVGETRVVSHEKTDVGFLALRKPID